VKRTYNHSAIPGSQLVVLDRAPHGISWIHADAINASLLEFPAAKPDSATREAVRA